MPRQFRRPPKPGEGGNGRGGNGGGPADAAKEASEEVVGWVEERTGAGGFLTFVLFRKVPRGTNWFYTLGSATLFAFTHRDNTPSQRILQKLGFTYKKMETLYGWEAPFYELPLFPDTRAAS